MEMKDAQVLSRRDFGALVLAGVPLSLATLTAAAKINSTFGGVQIGAITYSFRTLPTAEDVLKAMVQIGLGEAELMANHAEALLGAPPMPRPAPAPAPATSGGAAPAPPPRPQMSPEFRAAMQAYGEEIRKWRASAPVARFKDVRQKFDEAGIDVRLFTVNMNKNTTDDEIEYAFQAAKALGVRAITTSTQVSVAKRVAPFADKHKLMVGYHGHANLTDPDEFATPASFQAAMAMSKYHGVNLDIGHFTAANFDAVPFIKEHHARITNLHLKDRKKNEGPNVPWGQGDTPIKEVLLLMKQNRYDFPANIEFEYPGDPMVEVPKCLAFCKQVLTT